MNRSLTIAAASLTLVGCGAGVRSSASEAASTAVESTVPVPNAPASGAAVADCLVGQWDVDAMTSVADPSVGFDLSGITAAFDGANLTITAVAASRCRSATATSAPTTLSGAPCVPPTSPIRRR